MTADPRYFTPTADRKADLRRAFGCFGTGVTVVTTQTTDGPLGMTANSFSSISLTPPLVLWSPAVASRRHDAFIQAESFCIHVLAASQLNIARHFASNGGDFDTFDWAPGALGAPRLSGCLAEFYCTTHAVHPAGDHSLVLGEVQQVA
ncbi:MAG: flavin reductase family protein, partial [Pseudomonadota bacterium]